MENKSKPKAVFLDAYTLDPGDNDLSILSDILDIKIYDSTPAELVLERSKEAEIIIVNKVQLRANDIAQLSNLRFIQVAATGYNNVDTLFARKQDIPVSNISGYSTSSVVQHVFAMLFNYLNETARYNEEVRQLKWSQSEHFSYWHKPIRELNGKNFGILGYGTIGKSVASVARAFGAQVLVHTRTPGQGGKGVRFVDKKSFFSESDIISLHAPLNRESQKIINRQNLELMKQTGIIINTARGGLIDEKALVEALKNKTITAALLDVLEQEPPDEANALQTVPGCYITPHQAWASLESRHRLLDLMCGSLKAYLSGEVINVVN